MDPGLIRALADYGISYLLLAISISLNFFLIKMLLAEKDKRIEEASRVTANIVAPLSSIKDSVATLVDSALRRKR